MISKEVFSSNLRKYMSRDNLNQVELAKNLGVTKAAVNYWVNGRSIPQVSVIQHMAELFCCSTDDLIKEGVGDLPSGSTEERLLFIFRQLSDDGQKYLLQQASIAAALYGKKEQNHPDADSLAF